MVGRRTLLSAATGLALAPAVVRAQQEAKLTLGTAEPGGAFVLYGEALVDMLKAVDPVLEMRARATKGTGENVALLETGEIDLGLVAGEVAHELFLGFNRPQSKLRVISAMYASPGMFVVLADTRYRSITQLKGQPVVWNTAGSGFAVQARYVMDGLGLDMDKDFEPIYVERLVDGPPLVLDGRAAALWGGGLRWPGFVTVANNPRGGRFVAPTVDEIARIRAKYEFMRPFTVPAGLYHGQYDPIETIGTWSFIFARADFDDATGRRLAAAFAKADRTGALTKQLAGSTAKNTVAAIPNPDVLQAGVARYYRENGLL